MSPTDSQWLLLCREQGLAAWEAELQARADSAQAQEARLQQLRQRLRFQYDEVVASLGQISRVTGRCAAVVLSKVVGCAVTARVLCRGRVPLTTWPC